MDSLPEETRQRLKEDLAITIERIENLKSGISPNYRVLDQFYTSPLLDDRQVLPLSHDCGEFAHYKELGHMVLEILLQGRVPPQFKPRLETFKAPDYIMQLL
jgi:hypothetical protein